MFFDPQSFGSEVAVEGRRWEPKRAPVARRRPSNDFLTLPAIDASVLTKGVMQWGGGEEVRRLIASQFDSGPLRLRDVPSFDSAAIALSQGFFGWVARQQAQWSRLHFNFVLCDVESIQEQIQYQYDAIDFEPTAPLYLGVEVPEESLYEIGGRAEEMRKAHPRLLASAMALIDRAAARTVWIRTPDEFLGMFAQWHWDGDPQTTDEEAMETLRDRFGEDESEIHNYLPSVVRDELCPDDMDVGSWSRKGHCFVRRPALGIAALRRIRRLNTGWIRRLCLELEALTLLLRKAGNRNVFDFGYRPECVYAACSLVACDNEHVSELLDSHYEHFNSGGDGSLFFGFIPFANSPDAVRKQYADWALGFSILNRLDRVLALVSE